MGIFKNILPKKEPFCYDRVRERIVKSVQDKYPDYIIIISPSYCAGDNARPIGDLLIIRSVEHTVKETIGAFNHESTKKKTFQEVFVVTIKDMDGLASYDDSFPVKTHIVTDSPKFVLRMLGA